jgi:hypothetical protein
MFRSGGGAKAHVNFEAIAARLNSLVKKWPILSKTRENIPQGLKAVKNLLGLYRG